MTKPKTSSLTVSRLREVLEYNPETGLWTWLSTLSIRRVSGSQAGELKKNGYIFIGIDCERYRAHRLAWFYVYGKWPQYQIDHINGNRSDNRLVNLRLATNKENSTNRDKNRNNTSGFKGVFWNKRSKKWTAKINNGSKQIHLGNFYDPLDAHNAYIKASKTLFGDFGRG